MQAQDFNVELDNFSGPLDVLLHLIKKDELDICDISLGQVTGGYIRYIQTHSISPTDYNWFLNIATSLILSKSRALLEDDESAVDDEEDMEALAEQLKALAAYKELTKGLRDLSRDSLVGRHTVITVADEYGNLSTEDLYQAITQVNNIKITPAAKQTIRLKRKSNRELRQLLLKRLKSLKSIDPKKISSIGSNNAERVAIFMLILELIKSSGATLTAQGRIEVMA